jgi:hypothetical protein
MSDSDEEPIKFGSRRSELFELAVVTVEGGTNRSLSDAASKRRMEILAANRQELAIEVFKALEIPAQLRGDAVEPRAIHIVGQQKPWTIDVCTVTDFRPLEKFFGPEFSNTVCLDLKVKCLVDLKAKRYETVDVMAEVGPVGKWNNFRALGGRGKRVVTDASMTGTQITVTLDQNIKAYQYNDPEWQGVAARCARRHLKAELYHDLTTEEVGAIRIEHFATEAIVPISNLRTGQSARGIKVHYIVYGMCFELHNPNHLVSGPRIALSGAFPTGHVEADGLTPVLGPTKIRIKCPGLLIPAKAKGGYWYPPSAQTQEELAAACEDGDAPAFPNQRTLRRKEMRQLGKQRRRASTEEGLEEGQIEEGQISDGQSSTVSKMARQLGAASTDDLR